MKKLALLAGALLLLLLMATTGVHLQSGKNAGGASDAYGSLVDSTNPSGIAAVSRNPYVPKIVLLTTTGDVWDLSDDGERVWTRRADLDPPIPVSDIQHWDVTIVVATDGTVWHSYDSNWVSVSGIPVSAVLATWGQLKQKYGEKK